MKMNRKCKDTDDILSKEILKIAFLNIPPFILGKVWFCIIVALDIIHDDLLMISCCVRLSF